MKITAIVLSITTLTTIVPAFAASECGMQIQAIERRMQSAGASEVTGKPMNPDAKAQASNEAGRAPAPTNPAQTSTPDKMKTAQTLIDQAKTEDAHGQKDACEHAMMQAQQAMGAVP